MNFTLPQYPLKIEEREGIDYVWDHIRKKWLQLTPEEYVRQQLIEFLIREKNIAPSLIGIEKGLRYNKMAKRLDVLVFDQEGKPFILCECKAPSVKLSQETLYQVARYNVTLNAPHIVITNGASFLFFSRGEKGNYEFKENAWYK